MEPTSTGSITSTKITITTITKNNGNNYEQENINYLNPSFLNHRGNYHQNHNQFNTSIQEENAILSNSPNVHSDSGYNSSYCNSILTATTATNYNNSGANISYVSTIATTPPPSSQKLSNHSYQYHHISNLNTIPENSPDAGIKLTPVTKNIRKILNIHITTPKSQNNLSTITPTINVENYDGNDVDDGLDDDKLKIERDDIVVAAPAAAADAATATATKRNILTELVFDDYQSTPKKKKLDDNRSESCQKLSGARSIISSLTPLRDRRAARIHKKPYRKKLRSAPNFDAEFFNRDNAENIEDIDSVGAIYHTSHFTPIRSPYIQDKRTPLSSSSSNLMQASTPKSLGKYDNSSRSSSSVFEKSASVRKLLSFSDKEFEALLGSSAEVQTTKSKAENSVVETEDIYQEDSFREYKKKQPIISLYTSIVPPYVPETDAAKKSFKRTLKFAFQATPSSSISGEETPKTSKKATPSPNVPLSSSSAENNETSTEKNDSNIFHDDNFNDYKALYPIIGNVIHDRRILKRERSSTTARLIDIKRESFSLSRLNRTGNGNKKFCSSETIKQNKIERDRKESRGGFQKILGYKPSSYDLKISPRFDDTKDDGEIGKKLTDEGSDMDVSMASLKSSANRNKLNIKNCESMREMNEKLLKCGDETHILDSDLDISKESIKIDNKKNLSGGECDMDISLNVQQFETDNVSHESVRDCNLKMFKYEQEFCKFELNLDISKEISDLHKSPFPLSPSTPTPPPSSSSLLKNERSEDDLILFNSNNSIKIPDFSSIHFEKEIGEITPPRRRRSSSPLCQSNDNDNVLKVSFSENEKFLPTTPKKIKQHNNHHHTTIDYEKNEILHPTIPRTPSKKSSLTVGSSATTSSASLSSIKYKYAPISLKRKASISKKDTDKRSKIFYDGCTHLNILAKLERYDLVLDRIFDMLSSQDLINLTLTSKQLRNIVLVNQKSRNRISKFITEHQKTKENNDIELNDVHLISDKLQQQQQYQQHQQYNYHHHHHHQQQTPITRMKTMHKSPSSLPMISSNGTNFRDSILQSRKFSVDSNCGNNAVAGTRLPFKNCNLIFDQRRSSVTNILQKSPPVSPSKRKFHENQKVVKLLSANEKLIKCPRCSRSSRIIKIFPSSFDEFSNQFSNHHNYNNNNNNNSNNKNNNNNESQKIFKMYTTTTTTSNQQETFHASTLSTLKNFNSNNNDNYNDFVPISNSQSVSNQFVPVSSKISSNKSKFVKSMSVDSAYFMPVTPIKRHHHHHQQSQFSNYSNDVAVNNFSTNLQQQQYGECTGIACKYRFCLDCLCEYHPNSPCKITTALNNSPSKEDVQNGILQINSLSSVKKMTATTKMTTITSSSTTTATAATSAPAPAAATATAASTAATSNSRSLKIRRKSLKRLCF